MKTLTEDILGNYQIGFRQKISTFDNNILDIKQTMEKDTGEQG